MGSPVRALAKGRGARLARPPGDSTEQLWGSALSMIITPFTPIGAAADIPGRRLSAALLKDSVSDAPAPKAQGRGLYVQYGCAFSPGEGWINFDSSPTLRIERLPVIGPLLSRKLARNRQPFPRSVQYGDVCKGLPIKEGSASAVYASHVLEHLSLNDCRKAIANTFSLLAPGGAFRLIVPDLEGRARKYLEELRAGSPEAASHFLRSTHLGLANRARSPIAYLRQMLGASAHLWMWDEPSMRAELERAGFVKIRRCKLGDSGDPMFSRVESADRFCHPAEDVEEVAFEARKPG
jgi:Methyltransferase domain